METIKTKIENETQYNWAMGRIEELLPKVNDDTPDNDPNSIELYLLSGLVQDYEDVHYPIGAPSLIDVLKLRMYEMCIRDRARAAPHCEASEVTFSAHQPKVASK